MITSTNPESTTKGAASPISAKDLLVASSPQQHNAVLLRDFFAGVALQGWLASFTEDMPHPVSNDTHLSVAEFSYRMADAMIAARDAIPAPAPVAGK